MHNKCRTHGFRSSHTVCISMQGLEDQKALLIQGGGMQMVTFPVLGQVGREHIWDSIPCFSNLIIEIMLPPFIVKGAKAAFFKK